MALLIAIIADHSKSVSFWLSHYVDMSIKDIRIYFFLGLFLTIMVGFVFPIFFIRGLGSVIGTQRVI